MKHIFRKLASAFTLITALLAVSQPAKAQSDIWVSAYYAGWMQGYANNGRLPAEKIDFSALTHIVHFSLVPRTDGTLNAESNSITLTNSQALVSRAHAAGKKVIISVGGWASDVGFRGAVSSANRSKFINNLISFVQTRGYDGIDIDWERLEASDATLYVAFINDLRAALDALSPRPLLTAAVGWQPTILAQVHTKFDQINLMTYDFSGAWPGWVTWHNSPIYDGGFRFPSTGGAVPSIDGRVNSYAGTGIPASKIGVGIDFYGYVWSGGDGTPNGGATDPRQSWTTAPSVQANVPYYTIMDNYYQSQYYRFDNAAQVSYLSINNTGSANDKFISYDDEQTAKKKIEYARSKKIGGVIIWELGGGVRTNMPAGQQDPLLQAVKEALLGGTPVADGTPPSVSFTAPASGSTLTGTVNLSVNASDNVGVADVQFKVNGSNLGNEVTSAPYTASLNTTSLVNGAATLTAVARDAAGNQATATLSVTVSNLPSLDVTPPTVSFAGPANGTTVSGNVGLTANASDNIGVAGVQFTVDGANLGNEITSAPYTATWNASQAASGSHTLAAIARDAAGNRTTATVTVLVSASTPPPSSNTLTVYDEGLQSPWINNSWSATVTFDNTEQASAGTKSVKVVTAAWGALSLHYGSWGSNPGINPANYESFNLSVYAPSSGTKFTIFFENDLGQSFPKVSTGDVATGSWKSFSFSMSQMNPNSQAIHRISVQEVSGSAKTFYIDNIGFGGSSTTVPSADTTAPVVALTQPADGATVSGTVSVSATASDNIGVQGVRFLLGGNEVQAEDASSPYGFSWNTTQAANGTYVLSAVARDSAGNESTASVTVTVSNVTTPPATSGLVAYDDALQSPWINASWSAAVTFGSTEKAFAGTSSIKVVQNAWGALRLHSGPWGNQVDVDGSKYDYLEFSVFGGSVGVSIGVFFENDLSQSFPSLKYQWVGANQWKSFSIPMATLNPSKQKIHRVVIQDLSGRQRTFYVDEIRFRSGAAPSTSVAENGTETMAAPESFGLSQNYPNPFNPTTTISYNLPFEAKVTLEIFNMVGERVATLVDQGQNSGMHSAMFDAHTLASGTYVYRLTALPSGESAAKPLVEVRRMILMK